MGLLVPGRARRLKAIAKYINENWPDYEARIVEGYCDTDRKIPGSRLRIPGRLTGDGPEEPHQHKKEVSGL